MASLLIAAALANAALPTSAAAAPALPDASPAIWVVNDHDTIIYLFGTFHALDGQSDWFNDEVLTAFAASEELVLETLVPKLPTPAQSFTIAPGKPFAPMAPVAGSASFLSTTKQVMAAGRSNGMSTARGADTILREAAEGTGKPVTGLETFEFQIGMFSRLPGAPKATSKAASEQTSRALATVLAQLQAAWNSGDIERFAPMLDDMAAKSPDTYRLLFAERNARWADWIDRRLDRPGTVFVAVGAGHLVGRHSVQANLAGRGVESARIN